MWVPFEREVQGLELVATERALTLRISPRAGIRFTSHDGSGHVRLLFGTHSHGPDVSVQPAAVVKMLDDHGRVAGVDPNRWRVEALRALREWSPGLAWVPLDPAKLGVAVGAFTHPLLASVYREGRATLGEVPRWASPVLRAPSPTAAARELCGARTNRRLTRVLAASLLGHGELVDLGPLALGVCASDLVSLDELANVIEAAAGPDRPLLRLPSDDLAAARTALRAWPEHRRGSLLLDVARRHDAAALTATMTRLRWVIESAPRPLPTRLAEVDTLCDRLIPVLAPPAHRPPRAEPRHREPGLREPAPESHGRPGGNEPGHTALRPARGEEGLRPAGLLPEAEPPRARPRRPGARGRVAPQATRPDIDRWDIPQVLRPVHDQVHGELRFCVPTSAEELRWWSRQLGNCLDTFAAAAAAQRSWLVGIRRDDLLIGCVEVCPRTRNVRQAQGPRQRALPPPVYDTTIAMLRQHGILRAAP